VNLRPTRGLAVLTLVLVAMLLPSLSGATTSSGSSVRNGRLTISPFSYDNQYPIPNGGIDTVGPHGGTHLLYLPKGCCIVFGLAWSPKGTLLAYSLTCISCPPPADSALGLHVVNLATRKDIRILPGYDGFDLDWSRQGSRIAFVMLGGLGASGSIYVTKPNGTHTRRVLTGTQGRDTSPSFSPRGTRLVFATLDPSCPKSGSQPVCSDQIVSIVHANGSHRRFLIAHATTPAWSPSGRLIAIRTLGRCSGIKLLTPTGKDVTPRRGRSACRVIGVAGTPIWSPNGRRIAIQTTRGIYVMKANGTGLALLTRQTGAGELFAIAPVRPAWRPR